MFRDKWDSSARRTRTVTGRLVLCACSLLTAIIPSTAHAYLTNADLPEIAGATERVVWTDASVAFRISGDGPGAFTADATRLALLGALQQWTAPTCSALELQISAVTSSAAAPGDGQNTVQWLNEGWPGSADSPGYTDVQLVKGADGVWAIEEADIYLNSKHATLSDPAATTDYLRAILAHEVGHVVGLIHPCEMEVADGASICGLANDTQLMHPIYAAQRTELSSDEVEGLCFLYPKAVDPGGTPATPSVPDFSKYMCQSDGDCQDEMHCAGSTCVGGLGELGDPCKHAGDCASAACREFCSEPCATDSDCEDGASCKSTKGPTGACVGARVGYGETCKKSEACLSGYCLEGVEKAGVCTRLCGIDELACPLDWTCQHIEAADEDVCAPLETPLDDSGCALGAAKPGRSGLWNFALLLGALVGMYRRLRSRGAAR